MKTDSTSFLILPLFVYCSGELLSETFRNLLKAEFADRWSWASKREKKIITFRDFVDGGSICKFKIRFFNQHEYLESHTFPCSSSRRLWFSFLSSHRVEIFLVITFFTLWSRVPKSPLKNFNGEVSRSFTMISLSNPGLLKLPSFFLRCNIHWAVIFSKLRLRVAISFPFRIKRT